MKYNQCYQWNSVYVNQNHTHNAADFRIIVSVVVGVVARVAVRLF